MIYIVASIDLQDKLLDARKVIIAFNINLAIGRDNRNAEF